MRSFPYHCDAGHGWLIVSGAAIVAVGLRPWDFSKYSYVNRRCHPHGPQFALEEDCDMPKFLAACTAHGVAFKIEELHITGDSVIRNWPRNGR
jgi:hypothetical protein